MHIIAALLFYSVSALFIVLGYQLCPETGFPVNDREMLGAGFLITGLLIKFAGHEMLFRTATMTGGRS